MDALLAAALEYAERGWKTFPVNGKLPMTPHGVLDATNDLSVLTTWFSGTNTGIALATGTGLVVLDVDPKHDGFESLAELEIRNERLPRTLAASTPSGGIHYYFRTNSSIRNSAGRLGSGLDIRGDGGYVVCPPSPGYEWDLGTDEIAMAPAWILTPPQSSRVDAVELAQYPDGQRNSSLASLGGSLRRRGAPYRVILAALLAANTELCNPPLPESEVEQIAHSLERYEPDSPRSREGYYRSGPGDEGSGPAGSGLSKGRALRRPNQSRSILARSRNLRGRR